MPIILSINQMERIYDKARELDEIAPKLNKFNYEDIINLENAYIQMGELIKEIKLNPFKINELEGIYDFHNELTVKLFKNLRGIYKKWPLRKLWELE